MRRDDSVTALTPPGGLSMPSRISDDALWSAAVADFRRSGLTQPEFCRGRGLPLHTFRRRLYRRDVAPAPAAADPFATSIPPDMPRFVPVTLFADPYSPAPAATTSDPLVLILDNRLRIAVAPGFDPETLRRLIEAIEARP